MCIRDSPFPHHRDECRRDIRIEFGSDAALDVCERRRGFPRVAIGPLRPQRIVHVADVYQRARLVAVTAKVSIGITAAVDHDMVLEGHERRHVQLLVTLENESVSYT